MTILLLVVIKYRQKLNWLYLWKTVNQNRSSSWYDYYNGRIIASIFHEFAVKVSDTFEKKNHDKEETIKKNVAKKVAGGFTSKAIESVKKNKPTNRQAYFQKNATKHKKPNEIEKASPDRIVTCQLHKSVS